MKALIRKIIYKPAVATKMARILATIHQWVYSKIGSFAKACEGGVHPKHRLTRYHDFFVNNISTKETVLDVGCGNGLLLKSLAYKTGASVVGVDIVEENVHAAQANLSGFDEARVVCLDIADYDPGVKFNVIVLSNVLEHLEDRTALLRSMVTRFLPDKVLVRVPSFEREWLVPYKKELGIEWRLDPTHRIEYTEEAFKKEVHAGGLEIKSVEFKWGEIWAVLVPDEKR